VAAVRPTNTTFALDPPVALAAAGALFAAKALARFAELDQAVTALWRHLVVGAPVSCGEGFTAAVAR